MKHNNIFGMVALATLSSSAVLGAGAVLDNFDTFTTANPALASGFYLQTSSAVTATDSNEVLLNPSDTTFVSLQRKAELIHASGTATSTLTNGDGPLASPTGPLGHMLWGNQGSVTSARLTYTFASATDLTSYSQFDFNWISSELGNGTGGSVFVQVNSFTGGEGTLTGTFSYGSGVNFTASVPFLSLTGGSGNQGVFDNAKSIRFTFTANGGNIDYDARLNSITFSNPNVPEASTTLPAVVVAAGLGLVAWRRRVSK